WPAWPRSGSPWARWYCWASASSPRSRAPAARIRRPEAKRPGRARTTHRRVPAGCRPGDTAAMNPSSNDPLVQRAAALVLDAFEDYDARFGDLTRRARRRFVRGDWRGAQADALARIDLQDGFLPEALGRFEALVGERMRSRPFWAAVRQAYAALTAGRSNAAMARTLFNSMSRRFFLTEGVA